MEKLKFVCQKCKGTRLAEVSNAIQVHLVEFLHDIKSNGYFPEYNLAESFILNVACYECKDCGTKVPGVFNEKQMIEYLKGEKNG